MCVHIIHCHTLMHTVHFVSGHLEYHHDQCWQHWRANQRIRSSCLCLLLDGIHCIDHHESHTPQRTKTLQGTHHVRMLATVHSTVQ